MEWKFYEMAGIKKQKLSFDALWVVT